MDINTFFLDAYGINIDKIDSPNLGGYLNNSFVVTANNNFFFLQEINKNRNLLLENAVLLYLKKLDFPVPEIVKTKQNLICSYFNNKKMILTRYIEGYSPIKFNDLSLNQIIQAAKKLAEFHKLMLKFDFEKISRLNVSTKQEAINICSKVKIIIKNKFELDKIDLQISKIIDDKINLLQKYNESDLFNGLEKCLKIFCHGDYHGANLIFNEEDNIIGVVDWEFFGYDYRVWEVLRSMAFICDINYTGSLVGPIDFCKARIYLKAYNDIFPLTNHELDIMTELIQYKSLCCCFVLEKHYLEISKTCDIFIPKKSSHWFWWIENVGKFKKEVVDCLK